MTSSITAGASAGSREIGSAVQKFAAVSTVVVVSTGRELSVKGIIGLFGAAVVASLYVSAFAQAPPLGSYQDSCRDSRMRGTTLTAVCSRLNGSEQLTALNVARCVGDIGNADGQLICNGGQPAEPVADRCGDVDVWNLTSHIYVSPKGTDSDSCGASPSSPCGSIQRGIDRCGAKGCGVLVRYGLYSLTEPIRLRQEVSVYGRCVFDGDSDRKYRSVIVAPPDGKPGIIADKILLRTVLDGVFVRGSDATSPGGASIAMTVSNSTGLAIEHTILSSGKGADGAPGQTLLGNSGEGGAEPQWVAGGPGGGGGQACPSSSSSLPGRGGDGGPGTWNNSKGCAFECACSNNNDPQGKPGQDSGDAKGGGVGGGGHPGPGCSGRGMKR